MPLHESDPRQLGSFRLYDRVEAGAEGVVYLARDSRGREVSVATLSSGAAADPAARDRFATAVRSGRGVEDAPKVLASSVAGPVASWVAVRGGGARGAEAYLGPVSAGGGGSGGAAAAPSYAPYWSGGRGGAGGLAPASAAWAWSAVGMRRGPRAAAGPNWPVVAALLVALLLFALLVVMLYMLLQDYSVQASRPSEPSPAASPGSEPPSASQSPQPSQEPGGEGQPTRQPTPQPSPSADVPSVEVDEDDYPPGDTPLDPEDQA